MRTCAVALAAGEPSRRALGLAARFASASGSPLHVLYAGDTTTADDLIGPVEAELSLQGIVYHTHTRRGPAADTVAALVREVGADVLFAGAHLHRDGGGGPAAVLVSNAEEILKHVPIPVVVQP